MEKTIQLAIPAGVHPNGSRFSAGTRDRSGATLARKSVTVAEFLHVAAVANEACRSNSANSSDIKQFRSHRFHERGQQLFNPAICVFRRVIDSAVIRISPT
jgi:hypothetical protein